MLSKTLQDALNSQINYELTASYHYLAMAAHFDAASLKGMAGWMKRQSAEEHDHAMRLYEHIINCGGNVSLAAIKKPNEKFTGITDVFNKALKLERDNTAHINKLYEAALKAKHYPTQILMQWFIDEQVEEEANLNEILDLLKIGGDKGAALLALDAKLGHQAPPPPAGGE